MIGLILIPVWLILEASETLPNKRIKWPKLPRRMVEHEAIMQALEHRDAETLVKHLSDHAEQSKQRVLKVMQDHE